MTAVLPEARLYIDGEWVDGESACDVVNPADQSVVAKAHLAGDEQVRAAVSAAHAAFPAWAELPARRRADYLMRIRDLLLKKRNEIAEVLSREQGKPLSESTGELIYSAEFFGWFAEECKRVDGELVPASRPGHEIRVEYVPVGVVGAISPWNFPAGMMARKIAPALAAGCTVVVKPASVTPMTAYKFFEVFAEIGLPKGVANLVIGSGSRVGELLLQDDRVKKITFTGSTEVGSSIMQTAGKRIVRVSLELGGHAPFIVLDDADIAKTIKGLVMIKMRNAGQTCIAPNRVFVHRSVYDDFINKLADRVKSLKMGPYDMEQVEVGPLIDVRAMQRMQEQVDDARAKGARLICGGRRSADPALAKGNFYEPTVLADVTPEMRIYREETFGPIIPLIPFDTDEEAIRLANDSRYGLAAYVYSENLKRARNIVSKLEYGSICVNDVTAADFAQAPFGGMKESGIGREGGHIGIKEFMEAKCILTSYN